MNTLSFPWMMIIPVVFSPIVYLAGRLGVHELTAHRRATLVRGLALLAVSAAWLPFGISMQSFLASGKQEFVVEAIWLRVDAISLFLAATTLTLGTLVVIFSSSYMAGEIGEEKYYAMLLVMISMMIGLGCAGDLFNLWVWFEGMAVSSYLLVAFYREQPASLEAGMKYLVQSATGSVLVLMGIAIVLSNTGALDLSVLRNASDLASANRLALLAAAALFIVGFGVKAALVPLHTWLPDAHSQAPSGVSAMLSGVVIGAGLIAMLRALGTIGSIMDLRILLLVFGAANILFGNLLALRQTVVKRMLAYSSLSHIGYILLGLGVAMYAGGELGAQGAMFHFFNHMLMKGLAFLAVGALIYGLYLQNGSHKPLMISELAGVAQKYPLVALALSIALLGLGGLPPLAGFMSKWQIFVGGFETQNAWIMALIVFAALNSVLSLVYYTPLISLMYRTSQSEVVLAGKTLPWTIIVPLVAMALAVIVLGFAPGLMDWLTAPAGEQLMEMFGVRQ
jgi:proton-translocating NADH-quinone oxidoreductase chain N